MKVQFAARAAFIALALAYACPAAATEAEDRAEVASGLKTHAVYGVIERYFPDVFDKMVTGLVQGLKTGKPMSGLVQEVRPLYIDLVTRETPKADPENTRVFMTLSRDQAMAGLAKSPHACLIVLGVSADKTLPTEIIPDALAEQELAYAARLLAQTATKPAPLPAPLSQRAIEILGMQAYDALPSNELRKAFGEAEGSGTKATTPIQEEAICRFNIALANILLARPGSEGTDAFRALTFATPDR